MNRIAKMGLLVMSMLMAACASPSKRPDGPSSEAGPMPDARSSPLSDFNFGKDGIPDVLLAAVEDTYAEPAGKDCATLGAEIAAIDRVLGPDLDVLKAANKDEDVVVRALAGAIRGLVPYRGILRMMTGANRRERRVAAAVAAGGIRRGYLKGLGEAQGCTVPAAPVHLPH